MKWRWERQEIQTATSGSDLLLFQKIEALEDVLSEAQSLLVDIRGLVAERENGGGRKEKSEAAVRKKRQQHKEKKNQEELHLPGDNNLAHILRRQGSVEITTTSRWRRRHSDLKVTSMVTFSFPRVGKNAKGDGDNGLLQRDKGQRKTHGMLTASELGIVALGYSDGSVALHDSRGERVAHWNANTGGSPVVMLSFRSRRGRSALVALDANGHLSSFELGAWRWGRCISGGFVRQQLGDDRLMNEMKDYWNMFEPGEIMSGDGLVVAIRSVEEQSIIEGGWCTGDPITAIEPIVLGGKEGNPMKLIIAVGNAAGNIWMIRANDGLTVALFPQVLSSNGHNSKRAEVISLRQSGSHLAAAFNGSSQLTIYQIPRNLIRDLTVDMDRTDVVPLEADTYGGCDAFSNVTSLSFDRTVPSMLYVGLENGHVISTSLKTFTYGGKTGRQNMEHNVYLPCRPKSTVDALLESVISLDVAEGYVLAGGSSSAVVLNTTSIFSLGLRRAFDVLISTGSYASRRSSGVMTSISDSEGTEHTRRMRRKHGKFSSTSTLLAVGNSNGAAFYEALLPQVASVNNNRMQWLKLPIFVVVIFGIAWLRLTKNSNNSDQKDDEAYLMGVEADLRLKQVELELARAEKQRWSGKSTNVNHLKPQLQVTSDGEKKFRRYG